MMNRNSTKRMTRTRLAAVLIIGLLIILAAAQAQGGETPAMPTGETTSRQHPKPRKSKRQPGD